MKYIKLGEFATDGVESTQVSNTEFTNYTSFNSKNVKGSLVAVNEPTWDLMMKNIYQIPGGSQLNQQDFKFNILYQDPSPLNYISQSGFRSITSRCTKYHFVKSIKLR